MNNSAIIIGIKAFNLSLDEKRLLQEKKPLGVILFSRNINTKIFLNYNIIIY